MDKQMKKKQYKKTLSLDENDIKEMQQYLDEDITSLSAQVRVFCKEYLVKKRREKKKGK